MSKSITKYPNSLNWLGISTVESPVTVNALVAIKSINKINRFSSSDW